MARRERATSTRRNKPEREATPSSSERETPGSILPAWSLVTDWRKPFLIPLLLLIAARLIAWSQLPIASEDAYITFRYARNLAAGNGLTYNPGEFVMGFTSPLWAIWNAIGFKVIADPTVWSRATTLAGDGLTLLLMGWLFQRHLSTLSAWCFTFFFAAWPYFSAVAMSGMENSMMFTLIALGAVLIERKNIMAGPTLAALALVRPEGVACAALLAVGGSWRDRLIALGLNEVGHLARRPRAPVILRHGFHRRR